jgi:hypothetical protein
MLLKSDRWSRFCSLFQTAEAASVVYQASEADFDNYKVNFLSEFESIFKAALAHESGP